MVSITTTILSLGGSLIVPNEIDIEFLKHFRMLVLNFIQKKNRLAIVCGGGMTCRRYQDAAKRITSLKDPDPDWIGIMTTRLNAELVRTLFTEQAYEKVVYDPTVKLTTRKNLIIGAGWQPGCTTDNDSVLFAENIKASKIINMTNIDYVYNKDPKKFPDAKPIKNITWNDFRAIIGNIHSPGINVPFDPVASKKAQQLRLTVIIINGKNLQNLDKCLAGKEFIGTVIA